MSELLQFSADLELRDSEERIVVGRLIPYGDRAQIAPGVHETIAAGALELPTDAGEIPLRMEHRDLIGHAVRLWAQSDGVYGEFRIARTDRGEEALQLLRAGSLRKMSAGFIPDPEHSDVTDGTITHRRGTLREASLVSVPAYTRADVLAVRNTEGVQVTTEPTTTEPSVVKTNETVAALEERMGTLSATVEELTEQLRKNAADAAAGSAVTYEPPLYRDIGELLGDADKWGRADGVGATDLAERLSPVLEAKELVRTSKGVTLELRAFSTPGSTAAGAAGVLPQAYIPELLELVRQGRVTAAALTSRPLPEEGSEITLPRVSQGALIDYQPSEGGTVANRNVETAQQKFAKVTLAGGQGVTIQAQRWSQPAYMDTVIRDHLAAYGSKVNTEVMNGAGGTTPPKYTGILNIGAPTIPVGGDTAALWQTAIGKGAVSVYGATDDAGTGFWPTAIIMGPQRWGWAIGLTDTNGRPLINQEAPQNPVGIGSARAVGTVRGLSVLVDNTIPTNLGAGTDEDVQIVTNFNRAYLHEASDAPAQIALTYPDVLVTDVSVYGFSALALRRAAAFAVLTGMKTPT